MEKSCQPYGKRLFDLIYKLRLPGEPDYKIAKRLGIPQTTFFGWRDGRCPNLAHLEQVAVSTAIPIKKIMIEVMLGPPKKGRPRKKG